MNAFILLIVNISLYGVGKYTAILFFVNVFWIDNISGAQQYKTFPFKNSKTGKLRTVLVSL